MPYIDKKQREKYKSFLLLIQNFPEIETKGDLEYLIMLLYRKYMSTREARYSTLHDACYAIQHVSDEVRRRFLDKRENDAKQKNGDV